MGKRSRRVSIRSDPTPQNYALSPIEVAISRENLEEVARFPFRFFFAPQVHSELDLDLTCVGSSTCTCPHPHPDPGHALRERGLVSRFAPAHRLKLKFFSLMESGEGREEEGGRAMAGVESLVPDPSRRTKAKRPRERERERGSQQRFFFS